MHCLLRLVDLDMGFHLLAVGSIASSHSAGTSSGLQGTELVTGTVIGSLLANRLASDPDCRMGLAAKTVLWES